MSAVIGSSYKIDLELVLYSQVLAFLFSIPLSVYASRRPGGKMDQSATSVTFAFYCLPAFILVVWFAQFFTVSNHIFPGPGTSAFPSGVGFFQGLWQNLQVMFLPSLILAIGTTAVYYRLLRGEMAHDAPRGVHHRRALEGAEQQPDPAGATRSARLRSRCSRAPATPSRCSSPGSSSSS